MSRKYISFFVVLFLIGVVSLVYFFENENENASRNVSSNVKNMEELKNIYEISEKLTMNFHSLLLDKVTQREINKIVNNFDLYLVNPKSEEIIKFYYSKETDDKGQEYYMLKDDIGAMYHYLPEYSEEKNNKTVYFSNDVVILHALIPGIFPDDEESFVLKVLFRDEVGWKIAFEDSRLKEKGEYQREDIVSLLRMLNKNFNKEDLYL